MSDALLYGKSDFRGIVGLEVDGAEVEIFIQDQNGKIHSIKQPHKYWLLSNEKLGREFNRLDGDLHYKYGYQTSDKKEYQRAKNTLKHNNDIYSIGNIEEAAMIKDGYTFYRDMQPKDLSVLSFDIETTGLDGNASDARILCISYMYRDKKIHFNGIIRFDHFDSESQMLEEFYDYILRCNPSLLIGHNILAFDFPYIEARCKTLGIKFNIGRDGSAVRFSSYPSQFRIDGTRKQEYYPVTVYGREIVDTYFLASSFDVSKSIESYALKPMIKQLGLEKEGRQYYDAGSIRDKYTDPVEWEKICQYAIEDAEDPIKLWDMMGPLYFHLAPNVPKPFTEILLTASGSKINSMMVRAYLQDKHSIPKGDEIPPKSFQGAISFAVPGIYKNCFKIDLEALYPSIILQYNVYDSDKDPKAYLIELVKIFKAKRLEYKKLAAETGDSLWQEMDTTAKSVLNSFYGFCAANKLNFNSLECAAFITEKAREILGYTIQWASGKTLADIIVEESDEKEVELA